MWKKIGSFLVLFVLLNAADIEITSAVDAQTLPLNQTLQYTLTFAGQTDIPGVNLPALSDFTVVGQSSSTQLQIINGRQSGSRSIIFVLQPKKEGKAIIPGFAFTHGQQKYFTKSIEIQVVAPQANVQQKADPFNVFEDTAFFKPLVKALPEQTVLVEMVPQKLSLYTGEKTLVEFRFYFERGFYQGPQYVPPVMKGLVTKLISSAEKPLSVEYNGKKMQLLKTVQEIYPLGSGIAEIGPAQVQYVDAPFAGVKTLETKPLTFTVKQLPPAPENYSVAVGQFVLQAKFKTTALKTGEAGLVTLALSGTGNLDMVNSLTWPNSPSFNIYLEGMSVQGEQRIYRYFLTPLFPGKYVLPELSFVYFDPRQGRYATAKTSLPALTVSGLPVPAGASSMPDYTDNTLSLRFDRQLLNTWLCWSGKLLLWGLGLLVGVFLGFSLYLFWTAPLRRLKRELLLLGDLADAKFAVAAKKTFTEIMLQKYKLNVWGLSTKQLQEQMPEAQRGNAVALVNLLEVLHYAAKVDLAGYRSEITQRLNQLMHG